MRRWLETYGSWLLVFDNADTPKDLKDWLHVEESTFSVHRLVQEAIRARMDEETQKRWAERVVAAVAAAFPAAEFANWPHCERLLLQGQQAFVLMDRWRIKSTGAANLLNQVGQYLWQRGSYCEAEAFHRQCLKIRRHLGNEHLVANSLNNLGAVLQAQGSYDEAERILQDALEMNRRLLGDEHPHIATSLNDLAVAGYPVVRGTTSARSPQSRRILGYLRIDCLNRRHHGCRCQ